MQVTKTYRLAALSAAVLAALPFAASAQLEEIVVTATRRETDLQSTPLSVAAFTAEQLELGGITNGRDLGIMVPNVVLNPGTGGAQSQFYIRGLPGVGLYVDGVWQDGFGFQQMNFSEMERVEVLRGPQGTLFGRNTNGGAVNMTTRLPADEFGARVKLERRRLQPPRRVVGRRRADHGELEDEVHDGDRQERRLPRGAHDTVGFRLARRHDLSRRHPVGSRRTRSRCASPTTTSRSAGPIPRFTA